MHEGHRDRMRGKLENQDESLTECEVLEIILFNFISRKNTNPIAHALLDSFCDLAGVLDASPRLLSAVAGVGEKTAVNIHLYGQAVQYYLGSKSKRKRLYNYSDVKAHVFERFSGCEREKLEVYMMDDSSRLLCTKILSEMQNDRVWFDSKQLSFIFSEVKPSRVILAHNHPSGNEQPSKEDDLSLAEFDGVCRLHGARLCDSIIYAEGKVYSYYYWGRLKNVRPGE